jgi:hypothetical protein
MDKKLIHSKCLEIIELKLKDIQNEILDLNQSVRNETKSSAGDKHETGRAMIQQEIDFANQRLKELRIIQADLKKINPIFDNTSIKIGSLIETNIGLFYFTIALGKIKLNDKEVNILSIQSPIGKMLKGKKVGEKTNLNGKEIIINTIF